MPFPMPDLGLVFFAALSLLIVASALWVVISPNLVHSAVSLLFTLFGIAGIYVFLYADFIAATQVVIYVGGILVLIIFGVMLTNKIENVSLTNPGTNKLPGAFFAAGLLFIMFNVVFYTDWKVNENFSYDYNINEWATVDSYYEESDKRWFDYNSSLKKVYSVTNNWNIYIYDSNQDEWSLYDTIENNETIKDVYNNFDDGLIIYTKYDDENDDKIKNKYSYNFDEKSNLKLLSPDYAYVSKNILSTEQPQIDPDLPADNILFDKQSEKWISISKSLDVYNYDENKNKWISKGKPFDKQIVHSAVYDESADKIFVFTDKGMIRDKTISSIGNLILTKYLLPFEIASIILLAALIGAAMLSRKKVEN